jgi:hypothetical protein
VSTRPGHDLLQRLPRLADDGTVDVAAPAGEEPLRACSAAEFDEQPFFELLVGFQRNGKADL